MVDVMSFTDMVAALERKYGGLSPASRKADIPHTTLLKIKDGETKDPRFSTLKKIADGLGQSLPDMLRDYGA